jgi:integrase/recombinase XerD
LGERVESFLTYLLKERRLSSNTLSAYRNDLRQFEVYLSRLALDARGAPPTSHFERLTEVTRDELINFFLFLRERGYAPATIARKMAAVKSLFQYLQREGHISTNPTASLGAPEVKKPVPRAISTGDVDALLRAATLRCSPEGLRDAAMLRLLCATGMRVTELVSLDLGDVDLGQQRVSCTGRSDRRRELPLDAEVVQATALYCEDGRPRLLRPDHVTVALFLNHRGRRLTRQGFWLIMKSMVRGSGVTSEVTPHTLRHSFAAHRLQSGTELHQLRDLLGHANISTTQIYTQVQVEPSFSSTQPKGDPVGVGS